MTAKRGPGRPRKPDKLVALTVRLPAEVVTGVRDWAHFGRMSQAAVVQKALREYWDRRGGLEEL